MSTFEEDNKKRKQINAEIDVLIKNLNVKFIQAAGMKIGFKLNIVIEDNKNNHVTVSQGKIVKVEKSDTYHVQRIEF